MKSPLCLGGRAEQPDPARLAERSVFFRLEKP